MSRSLFSNLILGTLQTLSECRYKWFVPIDRPIEPQIAKYYNDYVHKISRSCKQNSVRILFRTTYLSIFWLYFFIHFVLRLQVNLFFQAINCLYSNPNPFSCCSSKTMPLSKSGLISSVRSFCALVFNSTGSLKADALCSG